ncbi:MULTISPECIES: hypothetical protein [unclassified Methylophaga]|uniref:hypothetical protein n=1 Tax=unclassified Methylophaga TaxID=2629249 RepID=UPI000C514DB5|nr:MULTISPECIES: hypothetical protein [unclassified Methylophaga]MAL51018.1 hypothetical protein [Methylophaga sp.]MAM28791.1 hypothetical protein [Flavobacteriaceae bacterium]MBP23908.1 hypothetical protein [Methylophaga sp.]HCC82265.1 hypothetical protein [Methylophaga sp.]
MTQSKFITDRGQTVTIEEKLASIPYGWSGQIDVSGVEEREGHIYASDSPSFYGTYWVLVDGTEMWLEDFLDATVANSFAEEVKQAALIKTQQRH